MNLGVAFVGKGGIVVVTTGLQDLLSHVTSPVTVHVQLLQLSPLGKISPAL